MANADFSFNPDVTITPGKLELSGTVNPAVRNLQIYDETGSVPQIAVKDGTWTATFAFNPNSPADYYVHADYTDASGQAQTAANPVFTAVGITGHPYSSESYNFSNGYEDTFVQTFSSDGSPNTHADLNVVNNTLTETGDQLHSRFVFERDVTITNFHLGSFANHDNLLLPSADFANMADLLHQTTMVGGNAVITDHNSGAALTLTGISTAEMQAHSHDFSFGAPKPLLGPL